MKYFPKKYYLIALLTFILFIIPFFWLKPNEMDLGGDESRLFFYDPLHFISVNAVYFKEVITLGDRSFDPFFDYLPFVSLLFLIKTVINSPYFLISLLNGVKVSVSFLSIYLIIRTILQNSYKEKKELFLQLPAVLGGLLYTTTPIVIGNYDKALLSHDQIFLNPLCFYLILCYFIKGKFRYLIGFIVTTLIFATSFSWPAAPPLFSFYPLALVFLFLYVILILKKKVNYFHIFLAVLLFLGLHAFHFLPEAYSLLSPNNYINQRVFSHSQVQDDLNYFNGVLPLSKLSLNFLLVAPFKQFVLLSIVPVFFLFFGLCLNRKKDKTLFLVGIFFLITLYLVTANITHAGVKLYALFFHIPGFSMFRNFIGQWAFVYSFFYALLFGQAIYFFFKRFNNIKFLVVITIFIGLSFVLTSWDFFTGGIVNKVLFQTNNVKIPMVMDPKYEQTLSFIRNLNNDGTFVSFPFTDSYESVIHGLNDGAYEGLSPINWLTGKRDYNGYTGISPFGEIFFKLAKEKNYQGMKKMFGLLEVKYFYWNDDPKVYDTTFPGNPYNSSRAVLPTTQAEYKNFIRKIAGKEIYHNGTYHIFETDEHYFHPLFYLAKDLKIYKEPQTEMYTQTEPFFDFSQQKEDTYVDGVSCLKLLSKIFCNQKDKMAGMPKIAFFKVNPTLYKVHISNARKPFLLVFSGSFSPRWNISLSNNSNFVDLWNPNNLQSRHIEVNGYANAWYVLPQDVGNKSDYVLTIQLRDQKIFYIGSIISVVTLFIVFIYGIFFLFRR